MMMMMWWWDRFYSIYCCSLRSICFVCYYCKILLFRLVEFSWLRFIFDNKKKKTCIKDRWKRRKEANFRFNPWVWSLHIYFYFVDFYLLIEFNFSFKNSKFYKFLILFFPYSIFIYIAIIFIFSYQILSYIEILI